MKAFRVSKIAAEEIEEAHKLYMKNEKQASLNIVEQKEFSRIAITNPKDSNSIFVINNIVLSLKHKNDLKILMGESYLQENKVNNMGPMHIECDIKRGKNTEINTKYVQAENPVEMFEKEVIILLPGGGLFIEANIPLKEMMLNINWSEENI